MNQLGLFSFLDALPAIFRDGQSAQGHGLLSLDERGILDFHRLIASSPHRLNILSDRKVCEEEPWAHLAVVGKTLFISYLKESGSATGRALAGHGR